MGCEQIPDALQNEEQQSEKFTQAAPSGEQIFAPLLHTLKLHCWLQQSPLLEQIEPSGAQLKVNDGAPLVPLGVIVEDGAKQPAPPHGPQQSCGWFR